MTEEIEKIVRDELKFAKDDLLDLFKHIDSKIITSLNSYCENRIQTAEHKTGIQFWDYSHQVAIFKLEVENHLNDTYKSLTLKIDSYAKRLNDDLREKINYLETLVDRLEKRDAELFS